MKKTVLYILATLLTLGCNKFDDMLKNPDQPTEQQVDVDRLIAYVQKHIFSPDRETFWRSQLLTADRFADFFRIGFAEGGFTGAGGDGLAYNYNADYTDWYWSSYYVPIPATIESILRITDKNGIKPNDKLHGIGLVLKAFLYQRLTDSFGDIPYTQVADKNIKQPKYDKQIDIYKDLISILDKAISRFNSGDTTDPNFNQNIVGDFIYKGDPKKWEKLAKSLQLRLAMRAYNANSNDFSLDKIKSLVKNKSELLNDITDWAKIDKDKNDHNPFSDGYNNIWFFGGSDKSNRWKVSENLLKALKHSSTLVDPRLSVYAEPIKNKNIAFHKKDLSNFDAYFSFLKNILDRQNISYTTNTDGDTVNLILNGQDPIFIGQPARLSLNMKPLLKYDLFSDPGDFLIGDSDRTLDMLPANVMSPAEVKLLLALVSKNGIADAGNALELMKEGMKLSMQQFRVPDAQVTDFLSKTNLTDSEENIVTQLWLSLYGDGFEGWSVVRKYHYPASVYADIPNDQFHYIIGTLGVKYPQRLKYPQSELSLNGANVNNAIKNQGVDELNTFLWWAQN